jgi:hypothetical protein
LILQNEGDVVLAKQIQELRLHPPLVSNLGGKFLIGGQFLEQCRQPRQKLNAGLKCFRIEIGKLKQSGPNRLPNMLIVSVNCLNSLWHPSKRFSCVIS